MNRIRQLRKQRKITQKVLADHLQIADSTLSYWEMGKYEPDIDSLRKLSQFFHIPIDYIVGDEDVHMKYDVDADKHFSNAELIVSEPKLKYEISRTQNFNRDEFKDLTLDEIEKLAEYALFIKTLRMK